MGKQQREKMGERHEEVQARNKQLVLARGYSVVVRAPRKDIQHRWPLPPLHVC